MTPKRKRQLRKPSLVSAADLPRVKKMVPNL
jgi:ribosomal protein L35